jgi:peptidoglycan/xylan/chitin deacetylase (PgdA/CDA1 family)
MMNVVQCWDDGVTTDRRLVALLREYAIPATFNLNAALHGENRETWDFEGTFVTRLQRDEMRELYDGFTIANHSLTHPRLETLSPDALRREIEDGRKQLQDLFQQPVRGFAYPFGSYNVEVKEALRRAGHIYARAAHSRSLDFPPDDPMELHPTCHFRDDDFFERYDLARSTGVFYFWGHSYEMNTEKRWADLESKLLHIQNDPASCWTTVESLFGGDVVL